MADLRSTSLTERLRNVAAAEGSAVERVRNRLAFQRILARLALHDGWVLKGGFCLELRLGLQARATKDLDLLRQGEHVGDPLDLQDLLDEALDTDLGDSFTFRVRAPRQVRREDEMPSTWRVVVEVLCVGHPFGTSTLDVVTSETFPVTATERLLISSSLMGDEFSMPAVSLARHAAETQPFFRSRPGTGRHRSPGSPPRPASRPQTPSRHGASSRPPTATPRRHRDSPQG